MGVRESGAGGFGAPTERFVVVFLRIVRPQVQKGEFIGRLGAPLHGGAFVALLRLL